MGWSLSVNNTWRKYWRLDRSERRLASQAALVIVVTSLGHKSLGFKRCQSILGGLAAVFHRVHRVHFSLDRDGRSAPRPEKIAARTAAIVGAVIRVGAFRANCLQRSLALWCLLKGQGIEGDLRVGVQKVAGQLEAHAWVEYLGVILNDQADVHRRYVAFDRALTPAKAVAS
jgi:hypothetical protein